MARPIQLTSEQIEQYLSEARDNLLRKKVKTNSLNFSINLAKDKNIAELLFSPKAWVKMTELVSKFQTEVQWHGTVERTDTNKFFVHDILVFPHEITATTVTSNQEEYELWKDALDVETFNMLRLHGHSHVNMGVSPSGTDTSLQENVLQGLAQPFEGYDPYFIFLIMNKRGEIKCWIYDVKYNCYYDDEEVLFDVHLGKDCDYLSGFITDAKKLATEPKPIQQIGFGHTHRTYDDNFYKNETGKCISKPTTFKTSKCGVCGKLTKLEECSDNLWRCHTCKDRWHKMTKKNKKNQANTFYMDDYYSRYGIEDDDLPFYPGY